MTNYLENARNAMHQFENCPEEVAPQIATEIQVSAIIAITEQLSALTKQAKRIADVLEAHYQPNGWITVAGAHTSAAEREVTIDK